MKYALIRMPTGDIQIVDNSTHIGKGRVCRLIDRGGIPAGTIDSDFTIGALYAGFRHQKQVLLDDLDQRICTARRALNGDIPPSEIGDSPCGA